MGNVVKTCFGWVWSRKWWALVVLIVLGGLGFWLGKAFFFSKTDTSFVNTDHIVATGDVVESLSLAGTTQFANAQKLTFVNKGRVTSVKTKIGAHVKKGEVLATITTDDLDREVEKAKKELKNKQLELKKIISKSDKALDLLKAQSDYDLLSLQKQTLPSEQMLDLQTKQSEIQDDERLIKDKEKEFKEAQNDQAELLSGKIGATHAELSLSKNVRNRNSTIEKLIREFRDTANALQTTLDSYDRIMGTTEAYSREIPIVYVKNVGLGEQSKKMFWKAHPYVQKLNTLYTTFMAKNIGSITENELLNAYGVYKELGNLMVEWGTFNYDMFLEDTDAFSRSDKDSYASLLGTAFETLGYSYKDKYTAAVETLASLKDSDTTVEDAADKVEKLRIELEKLKIGLQKKKLEFDIAKKQQIVSSAELDKKIQDAELELEKAEEGNTQKDEIDAIQNELDTMQFDLTTLLKKYDEYKIIANFDGVVTKLDMQVGDSIENNASSDTQKYIYVETPDLLEVALEVDQIDIVKLSLNMPVTVTVDAFPGEVYSGYFSEIDTMPNGNSYKASVVFQKHHPEEKILGGMTANVNVVLNEEREKLIVPNPAIVDSEQGTKIVRLKKGENWIDQEVEVGNSDDMNTVILSGLKLGDVIKELYINDISLQGAGIGAEFERNGPDIRREGPGF